jgi:hypothetical protein
MNRLQIADTGRHEIEAILRGRLDRIGDVEFGAKDFTDPSLERNAKEGVECRGAKIAVDEEGSFSSASEAACQIGGDRRSSLQSVRAGDHQDLGISVDCAVHDGSANSVDCLRGLSDGHASARERFACGNRGENSQDANSESFVEVLRAVQATETKLDQGHPIGGHQKGPSPPMPASE